ncbi:MAG: thioredoxin [Chitinophagaceae bacterium]|nr:MAG: thioredoxin [Chitinophagaceae bacterium]
MRHFKIPIFFLFSFFFTSTLFAGNSAVENKGINFFNGTWEEVLEEAKKQNKPIFVDAFAVWCGPCKWMDSNVFPQEEVGDFYNANFINYKYDMEKGKGRDFARKYRVNAYPTFVYIKPNGETVHKTMGAKPPKVLIEEGQRALQIFNASR